MSPKELREHIAAEVRAELARQKKTRGEAAQVLGIARQNFGLKLATTFAFSTEDLVKLARWLNVPVAKFLPDTVDMAS